MSLVQGLSIRLLPLVHVGLVKFDRTKCENRSIEPERLLVAYCSELDLGFPEESVTHPEGQFVAIV